MKTYDTERLIQILQTVNPTAIDNDGGRPGEFLAEVCHQAACHLRSYQALVAKEGIKIKKITPPPRDPRQIDLLEAIEASNDSGC
jgi:hypothetical protein